jgi:hypothetical protein
VRAVRRAKRVVHIQLRVGRELRARVVRGCGGLVEGVVCWLSAPAASACCAPELFPGGHSSAAHPRLSASTSRCHAASHLLGKLRVVLLLLLVEAHVLQQQQLSEERAAVWQCGGGGGTSVKGFFWHRPWWAT